METVSSKMIGVILFVLCLFFIPTSIYVCINDITSTRTIMNETRNFIDKVADSGVCTDEMLSDFYLGCSSCGVPVNTKVKRYEAVINPVAQDTESGTQLTYTPNSDISTFNQGDVVAVDLEFIAPTGLQRIVWSVLRLFSPQTNFHLAGLVRN